MPDSMTFTARDGQRQCEFCGTTLATLDLEIRSARENSLQKGACCPTCAHNLVDALARIKPEL